jgi:hypothetical protein
MRRLALDSECRISGRDSFKILAALTYQNGRAIRLGILADVGGSTKGPVVQYRSVLQI